MWTFYCVLVCWCTTLTTGTRVCGMDESYILPTDFVRTMNGVLTVRGSITLVSDSFHLPCRTLLTVVYLAIDDDVIGGGTFANAANLTTIDAITSTIYIVEAYAFYNCPVLTTILLPDVIHIYDGAFALNVALTTVDWPVLTTTGVASFVGCSNLTDFTAPLLEEIGMAAFAYCFAFATLTLPSVVDIETDAFYRCTRLNRVSLPKAVSIGQMAFKNTRLVNVTLPVVNSIGYGAFADNTALERLTMPVVQYIGGMAFNATDRLHSLSIQNTNTVLNPTAFTGSFLTSPACYNWPLYSGFTYSITHCYNLTTSPLLTTIITTLTSISRTETITTKTSQTVVSSTQTATMSTFTLNSSNTAILTTYDDDYRLMVLGITVIVLATITWFLIYGKYRNKSVLKSPVSNTYRV